MQFGASMQGLELSQRKFNFICGGEEEFGGQKMLPERVF